jgi:hypothetical protein
VKQYLITELIAYPGHGDSFCTKGFAGEETCTTILLITVRIALFSPAGSETRESLITKSFLTSEVKGSV